MHKHWESFTRALERTNSSARAPAAILDTKESASEELIVETEHPLQHSKDWATFTTPAARAAHASATPLRREIPGPDPANPLPRSQESAAMKQQDATARLTTASFMAWKVPLACGTAATTARSS